MTDVYVIRNQLGHYWGKNKTWADGHDPHAVQRSKHEDEAVNTLFELSSKDFELRGEVLKVPLSERGEPVVEPSANPLPAEPGAEPAAASDAAAQDDAADDTGDMPVPAAAPERTAPTA